MTLLDSVRRQREKAENSLQAKALLVTYDFFLHRFDWVSSRRRNDLPCTVLPNQILQLLRPYLPITEDFNRSFAETFAIPEFRAIGGGSQVAAARMLQLLASYEGISESTASALLANDMLLRGLNRAKSDQELKEYVDSAIAAQNTLLVAEKQRLEEKLASERKQTAEVIRLHKQQEETEKQLLSNLREKEETTAALRDDLKLEVTV